jgi:hypothetical protein
MSNRLPYEEKIKEILEGLPVPDQDLPWEKMNQRLDEERKKRRFVPFPLAGCLGISLTCLLLIITAYFLWPTATKFSDKKAIVDYSSRLKKNNSVPENPGPDKKAINIEPINSDDPQKNQPANDVIVTPVKPFNSGVNVREIKSSISTLSKSKMTGLYASPDPDKDQVIPKREESGSDEKKQTTGENGISNNENIKNDALEDVVNNPAILKHVADSLFTNKLSSSLDHVQDSALISSVKSSSKKIFFAGGIGLQQQIPIAGQGFVPYDYYGRRSAVADFIPSLFLRLHQQDIGFLMAEFRYGAPQFVKGLPYNRSSVYDSVTMIFSTTTNRLLKTYYHQIPLTFNYYLKPGFSFGAGIMYSRFAGAVYEQEIKDRNVLTLGESRTTSLMNVKGFKDSFLYKTQWHVLFQTDFQWKKFMTGLRFSKDLEPYIKFTLPNGEIKREKNFTLQAIIRYQLFSK